MSNSLFTKYGGVKPYIIVLTKEHRFTKLNLPFEEGDKKDPKQTVILAPGTILYSQGIPFTENNKYEITTYGFNYQWGFGPCCEEILSDKVSYLELININELYPHNTTTLEYLPKTLSDNIFQLIEFLPINITDLNNIDLIHSLVKYQNEYGLWNSDDSFNESRFDIFIKDYEIGILN